MQPATRDSTERSVKVVDLSTLLKQREEWRREGRTVVWTNGCFDLVHLGHVRNLQAARRLGDVLVVGLNSDASVRRLKGPGRPIIPDWQRAEILAALECVSAVVLFEEDTAESALARLQPDVYCKGADYNGKPMSEAPVVQAYGGRVAFVPLIAELSTTNLLRRIRAEREG
jgi:rfaE bifunctional protein nucleotidyltransferase chain/domain